MLAKITYAALLLVIILSHVESAMVIISYEGSDCATPTAMWMTNSDCNGDIEVHETCFADAPAFWVNKECTDGAAPTIPIPEGWYTVNTTVSDNCNFSEWISYSAKSASRTPMQTLQIGGSLNTWIESSCDNGEVSFSMCFAGTAASYTPCDSYVLPYEQCTAATSNRTSTDIISLSGKQSFCAPQPVAVPMNAPVEAPVDAPMSSAPQASQTPQMLQTPQTTPVKAPMAKSSSSAAIIKSGFALVVGALFLQL